MQHQSHCDPRQSGGCDCVEPPMADDLGHTDACVHPDQHAAVIREWEDASAELERLRKERDDARALVETALDLRMHAKRWDRGWNRWDTEAERFLRAPETPHPLRVGTVGRMSRAYPLVETPKSPQVNDSTQEAP